MLRNLIAFDPQSLQARSFAFDAALYVLGALTLILSVQPTLDLFSKDQAMNYNYNSLHLVGAYGAFGSVTRERYEVILEGTDAAEASPSSEWREY